MFPIADDDEPGRGLAFVSAALIGLNILVFLFLQQLGADQVFTAGFSAIPFEITNDVDLVQPVPITVGGQDFLLPMAPGPEPIQLTLLSSMFMHGGLLHLGGNMLFLWIFGDNVEHRAGPIVFLIAYLATGVVGSLAQIWSDPSSPIPTLGASGAISGVLGAYVVLFPGNKVTVFLFRFLVVVPALVAIGLWIALQLAYQFLLPVNDTGGGVAYLAHIGGFAAGAVVGLVLRAMPARAVKVGPSR